MPSFSFAQLLKPIRKLLSELPCMYCTLDSFLFNTQSFINLSTYHNMAASKYKAEEKNRKIKVQIYAEEKGNEGKK